MSLASAVSAGIDVPRKAYSPDELDAAKAEAAQSGKPIVFVLSCPNAA